MNLFFYDVDIAYVKHLKDAEISKRGFTRIPDIEYGNRQKMVCGVGTDKGFIYVSCDFKLLEEVSKKYIPA